MIKAVLSLEQNTIPPNIFFDAPNPKIPFKEANLHVPVTAMRWPQDRSKRISVNCFGIGGANAHAILESTDAYCERESCSEKSNNSSWNCSRLLVVSAKNPDSLKQHTKKIAQYANEHPARLHDLAYTLDSRRQHLKHRAFAVAQPSKPVDASAFQSAQTKLGRLTFVFTGQGAQWAGMGKDLMDSFESFRDDIQQMDSTLQELEDAPGWSLQGKWPLSPSLVAKTNIEPKMSWPKEAMIVVLMKLSTRSLCALHSRSGL